MFDNDNAKQMIEQWILKLEEKYEVSPFNIYTGVDRSVFTGTFALTNAAYRADAYTDTDSLLDSLFGDQLALNLASIALDVVGVEDISVNLKFGVVVCDGLETGLYSVIELHLSLLLRRQTKRNG